MITPKRAVVQDMIKQIDPFVVKREVQIPTFRSFEGMHIAPGRFQKDRKVTEMQLGDTWETGYHRTRWFQFSVTVPPEMDGEKIYLQLDFGGESLVRINGEIVGALTSFAETGWYGRDIVFLPCPAKAGQKFDVEVEATVESGNFCDLAMDGAESFTCTINTARLISVDEETEKYNFEIKAAFDSLPVMEDTVIGDRVYRVIDDSIHTVDFDFGKEVFWASIPKARKVLSDGLKKLPKNPVGEVYMVGHSHLDVAWLWTIREITRKTARTFINNIELMNRYPEFCFCQSQAVLYDYIKKYYPEIFEKVKEKVRSGQWEITGSAWVEADTNIASGEALIRQLLYGRKFFEEEFGVTSEIYWLPDCFGFSWALPQIIKKSGMKYFLTAKLSNNDTNEFPYSEFRWRSHSGDTVIAELVKPGYGGLYTPSDVGYAWSHNKQAAITDAALGMFGHGDGGGGCTYGMVENGIALSKMPGLPASHEGSATDFFKQIEKNEEELPLWDGELFYENHRGTYTSQAFVKKNNRRGEFLFRNAELISVLAQGLAGKKYEAEKLEEGWKLLLTNQFHDILPGSSIHEVYEDARRDYDTMREIGSKVKSDAEKALLKKISSDGNSAIVFNYNTFVVSAPVRVAVASDAIRAFDGDELLPGETVLEDGKTVLEFMAKAVPAVGFKSFRLKEGKAEKAALCVSEKKLENEYLRVSFDKNGLITSVFDKENDREVLAGKGNLLTIFQDKPIHESAWNLEYNINKKYWDLIEADSIAVTDSSTLKGTITIKRHFNQSSVEQQISLYAGKRGIVFDTTVDWHETEKTLKSAFELDIRSTEASYEIAHGAVRRPTHFNTGYDFAKFEVAAHKWADLSETGYGVSILNDCKYGYDTKGNRMRITLMRSPNCPDRTADHGINTFTYVLYPHKNSWQDGGTLENAFLLNQPLEAFVSKKQKGDYEKKHSFIELSSSDAVLDAFKLAEDGNGCILRVYEAEGRHEKVRFSSDLAFGRAFECNMMEQNEKELSITKNSLSFTLKPFEVKTFRFIP